MSITIILQCFMTVIQGHIWYISNWFILLLYSSILHEMMHHAKTLDLPLVKIHLLCKTIVKTLHYF